jgi:hypothetical protein
VSRNPRESGALRRLHAFTDERRVGAPRVTGLVAGPDPVADDRRRQVAEYRRRMAAALFGAAGGDAEPRMAAAPAAPPQRNWTPVGPIAIRRGQAESEPVVGGRVQDIAVSADGQRVYAAAANGGVWRSTDAGRTWEPTMDLQDPDPIDLDPGASGLRQVDTLACGAIALIDGGMQSLDRLYLGTGEGHSSLDDFRGTGMWASRDGGTTWTQEPALPGTVDGLIGEGVFAIAVDPDDNEHALAATTRGLVRRAPAVGATPPTWTQESPLPGLSPSVDVTSVVVAKWGGSRNFYAAPRGGPPITSQTTGSPNVNSGWTALATGFPTNQVGRITLGVSADDPPVLYALVAFGPPAPAPPPPAPQPPANGRLHGLYRLDLTPVPGGAPPNAWQQVTGVPDLLFGSRGSFQGWYDQAVQVDPQDRNRVYLGGSHSDGPASIYRCEVTMSGGSPSASCRNIGARVHPDIQALLIRPGSDRELWVGCDGGVFVTPDARGGPELFEPRNTGLSTVTLVSLASHPAETSYAFSGVQDNGGARYTGSEIWLHQLAGDGGYTVLHSGDQKRLLNGYTNASIRRAATDAARYSETEVDPPLGKVTPTGGTTRDERVLFYPPIVAAPDNPNVVAMGAERPWVSTNFGNSWTALPFPGGSPAAAPPLVRSLAFASSTRLWAGYSNGGLFRYDLVGGAWGPATALRTGPSNPALGGRPITCITVDPADAQNSVYLTIGGFQHPDRVYHLTLPPPAPPGGGPPPPPPVPVWQPRAGPAAPSPNRLLDTQHNVLVVEPGQPTNLYVGADIGVWQSTDAGANWAPLSFGLPDAAVFDLGFVDLPAAAPDPAVRLLRAATHGRGAWELLLSGPAPAGDDVELYLRANVLDDRRGRAARAGARPPADPGHATTLDASPDIRLDPPNARGVYRIDPATPADLVQVEDRCTGDVVAVSVPERPVVTRVHVVVRNRGRFAVGNVQASLLVGRIAEGSATAPDLPANWASDVRNQTTIDNGTWKTVAVRTVDAMQAGFPRVVTFELPSTALPPASESDGRQFALLVVLHHADDELPANAPTQVIPLVTNQRRTALRLVRGASISVDAGGPPGAAGLVVPLTTTLLARDRIAAAVKRLQAKVDAVNAPPAGTAPPIVQPTERFILALAKAAQANLDGGPSASIAAGATGAGIGSFALLGALGFELPGYVGLLSLGGGWVADYLRRGTPDPQMSLVKAPGVDVPMRIAQRAIGALSPTDTALAPKVRGFASGMVGAAAAGLLAGPQLADLLSLDSAQDWSRHSRSAGAASVEDAIRRRFLSSPSGFRNISVMLPGAGAVPDALWSSMAGTLTDVVGPPAARTRGWAAFEKDFDPGSAITGARLKSAYDLLLHDLRTDSWPAIAWWALLAPMAMSVPVSLLIARALDRSGAFFKEDEDVDERAIQQLLTVGLGVGAVPSFVYSMILWGLIDEPTGPFVNALVLGLLRAGLVPGGLAAVDDDDVSAAVRWLLLFLPLIGTDVYAAIRALAAGSKRPGESFVFWLQTFPAMTAFATLGIAGLLKGTHISHTDAGFWAPWAVLTAALLGVSIPISLSLASGGGYRSWFLKENRSLPVLSATAAAGAAKPEASARARVIAANRLWSLPGVAAPGLADQRYPAGMRPLARVWWTGDGSLEVRPADNQVVLRTAGTEHPVDVPEGTTVPALVPALTGALAGVQAAAEGEGDPAVPLETPALADPGDQVPAADAAVARTRFIPVGKKPEEGLVIRHAPRADYSSAVGAIEGNVDPFPVVPQADLTDLETSGLGNAADLAALLAMAAAPSLAPVQVKDTLPALPDAQLHEVVRVFRRWNLDERRLDEWRTLVAGGAPADPPPGGAPDPFLRDVLTDPGRPHPAGAAVAAAMGWVPLWRAWLKMAGDPVADSSAATAHGDSPVVTMPDGVRRPTNAELTDGIRFLFDLGDPAGP